jgi:hypothetical protein
VRILRAASLLSGITSYFEKSEALPALSTYALFYFQRKAKRSSGKSIQEKLELRFTVVVKTLGPAFKLAIETQAHRKHTLAKFLERMLCLSEAS